MRVYSTSEFSWKDNKLYLGKKKTGFSVFRGEEDLYWIKWPDGKVSADFYNLTRAKDNCVKIASSTLNSNTKNGPEKPVDAFK